MARPKDLPDFSGMASDTGVPKEQEDVFDTALGQFAQSLNAARESRARAVAAILAIEHWVALGEELIVVIEPIMAEEGKLYPFAPNARVDTFGASFWAIQTYLREAHLMLNKLKD